MGLEFRSVRPALVIGVGEGGGRRGGRKRSEAPEAKELERYYYSNKSHPGRGGGREKGKKKEGWHRD